MTLMKTHWLVIIMVVGLVAYVTITHYLSSPLINDATLAELKKQVVEQDESLLAGREFATAEYPAANPNRNVYFGDLHSHTSLSFDSYLFGNRLNPDQAYRFAKGQQLESRSGEVMQISRPLDFAAVTDHAEGFGLDYICADQSLNRGTAEFCTATERPGLNLFMALRKDGTQRPPVSQVARLVDDSDKIRRYASQTWADIVATAERHNEPGRFTAFAAYEYSPPLPDRGKIHRNVIFKGSEVPAFAPSAFEALTELDLWSQLNDACQPPCRYLTIPHNPNKSWGLAFAGLTIDGDRYTQDDWAQRQQIEPIVEMYQIKGNSECSLGATTTDEECALEQFLPRCEPDQQTGCIFPTSMARDGLQQGLALQEALGFNPLQFGLIGSTDTHNANPGDTEEWDFRGSNGLLGASAHYRVNGVPGLPNGNIAQINPGGLAAVWSEQNTRAHLFDAMQRKEVYATSGTRIRLRFFGGTALQPDVTAPENLIADAYDRGVPMGSEFVVPEGDNPGFLIIALKDPLSAPLDKIQIIKIWRADGDTHEAVHDVVCSGDREPDPITRRCPPIDATVNLADCSFDPGSGSAELTAHWFDDHFASHQNAAYYARVIEAPTCRYSTFDSLRLGIAPRQDIPATVTEMAWSSPIWVSSQGVER